MWTAGETLGFALGPGLVLVVLALTGFVSSKADEQVTQPDSAITGVLMAFTAVPAILVLISIPFIHRYGVEFAKLGTATTPEGSPVMTASLPPAFPDQGLPDEVILATLAALRELDVPVKGGRTTSYVYDPDRDDLEDLGPAGVRPVRARQRPGPDGVPELRGGGERPGRPRP